MASNYEFIVQTVKDVTFYSSEYGSDWSYSYKAMNIVGEPRVYPNYADSSDAAVLRTYGNWSYECPSALEPVKNSIDEFVSNDFIDLFFERPVVPITIKIYETFNPGAIVRILGCYREADSDKPINTRCLKWHTLWKNQPRKYPQVFSQPEFIQMFFLLANGIQSNEFVSFDPSKIDEDTLPPALWFASKAEARIFKPLLKNVPRVPVDLFRIEFDSRLCSNYTEIDAVEISGWAKIVSSSLGPSNWPQYILSLPPPCTESSARDEERIINNLILPRSFFKFQTIPSNLYISLPFLNENRWPYDQEVYSILANENSPLAPIDIIPFSDISTTEREIWFTRGLPMPNLHRGVHIEEIISDETQSIVPYRNSFSMFRTALPLSTGALLPLAFNPFNNDQELNIFQAIVPYQAKITPEFSITLLPLELLVRVFSFLDVKSLCRTSCVCKRFYLAVSEIWATMKELNLQGCWPNIKARSLMVLGMKLNRVALQRAEIISAFTYRIKKGAVNTMYTREAFLQRRRRLISERQEHLSLPQQEDNQNISNSLSIDIKSDPKKSFIKRKRSWSTNIIHDVELVTSKFTNQIVLPELRSSNFDSKNPKNLIEPKSDSSSLIDHNEANKNSEQLFESQVSYPAENSLLTEENASIKQCLRRLDLSWIGSYEKISSCIFARFLSDACTQLHTLRVSNCGFINDDCLLAIVNKCPQLQDLDLSSCTNISRDGINILSRLIHLRWLSLYRVQICSSSLFAMADRVFNLEHLNLGACINRSNTDIEIQDALCLLCSRNKKLKSLNLWRWNFLDWAGMSNLAQSCCNLQEIDIGWCISVNRDSVLLLVRNCIKLKKLFLSSIRSCDSEVFTTVANTLVDLEQLDLLGNTQLTFDLANEIITKCSKLRLFDLSWCNKLTADNVKDLRLTHKHCFIQSSDKLPDLRRDFLSQPSLVFDLRRAIEPPIAQFEGENPLD